MWGGSVWGGPTAGRPTSNPCICQREGQKRFMGIKWTKTRTKEGTKVSLFIVFLLLKFRVWLLLSPVLSFILFLRCICNSIFATGQEPCWVSFCMMLSKFLLKITLKSHCSLSSLFLFSSSSLKFLEVHTCKSSCKSSWPDHHLVFPWLDSDILHKLLFNFFVV